MRSFHSTSSILLITLAAGCNPLVTTQTKAPGIKISGECYKEGSDRFVKIMITAEEEDRHWKVEFEGAKPENLIVDTSASVTTVRWKLGQDHIRTIGIEPYELRLSASDKTYTAQVAFRSSSAQFLNAVFYTIITLH